MSSPKPLTTFRIVVYPSDVVNFTGRSLQHARRFLCQLRKDRGKNRKALITIREFCDYANIAEADVIKYMQTLSMLVFFLFYRICGMIASAFDQGLTLPMSQNTLSKAFHFFTLCTPF